MCFPNEIWQIILKNQTVNKLGKLLNLSRKFYDIINIILDDIKYCYAHNLPIKENENDTSNLSYLQLKTRILSKAPKTFYTCIFSELYNLTNLSSPFYNKLVSVNFWSYMSFALEKDSIRQKSTLFPCSNEYVMGKRFFFRKKNENIFCTPLENNLPCKTIELKIFENRETNIYYSCSMFSRKNYIIIREASPNFEAWYWITEENLYNGKTNLLHRVNRITGRYKETIAQLEIFKDGLIFRYDFNKDWFYCSATRNFTKLALPDSQKKFERLFIVEENIYFVEFRDSKLIFFDDNILNQGKSSKQPFTTTGEETYIAIHSSNKCIYFEFKVGNHVFDLYCFYKNDWLDWWLGKKPCFNWIKCDIVFDVDKLASPIKEICSQNNFLPGSYVIDNERDIVYQKRLFKSGEKNRRFPGVIDLSNNYELSFCPLKNGYARIFSNGNITEFVDFVEI